MSGFFVLDILRVSQYYLITPTRYRDLKMKASKANEIINKNLKSLFMQSMIKRKGWSQLEARSYLVEFVNIGGNMSLKDFMEAK